MKPTRETVLLVRLHANKFIHINEIRRAERVGNYVEITTWSGEFIQHWDEDQTVINQIRALSAIANA